MKNKKTALQRFAATLSYIYRYFRRVFAKALFRLIGFFTPHKGKLIVFDSMSGKQYSCNTRAIYEYMSAHCKDPDLRFVWAFREPERFARYICDPRTIVVRYNSFAYFRFCSAADAVVFNFGWPFADRKNQIRLQTWHGGGCYKKIGLAMNYNTSIRNWFSRSKMRDITHFVSSSRFFTDEVIRNQYNFHGEVLSVGMPRNDILVNGSDNADELASIRKELGIPDDRYVILYAPTYDQMDPDNVETLDYEKIKQAAEERFGKTAIFLYRGHHYSEGPGTLHFDLNASDYPDMRDLLRITDMLITNYSSSIWDFSFTGRPCLLFAPDLEAYEKYRGFDKDIHTWGFPVCETTAALEEAILSFDESKFKAAMNKHHEDLGSYESGSATRKICEFLAEKIGIETA